MARCTLSARTLLSTLTHNERSLKFTCRTWSEVAYASMRERSASVMMLDITSSKSMAMSSARVSALARLQQDGHHLVDINALSASAIMAFAGAACNSRARARERALDASCGPVLGIRASYMPHMLAFGNRILCRL